jgi:hypothetical protein
MEEMMRELIGLETHMRLHQQVLDNIHQEVTRGTEVVSPFSMKPPTLEFIAPLCPERRQDSLERRRQEAAHRISEQDDAAEIREARWVSAV